MSKEDIIIVGTGGQASVLIDIIEDENRYNILGLTSLDMPKGETFKGYPVLGNDDVLYDYQKKGINKIALGVGGYKSNLIRKKIFEEIKSKGFDIVSAIHPTSFISKYAVIGEGVVIYPNCVVFTDAVIGDNVIMAINSSVGHGTRIENHVLLSANVNIGADVNIGEASLAGIGAKVVSGASVGKEVLVAAGAIVTKPIGDNKTVYGIPAKEKN